MTVSGGRITSQEHSPRTEACLHRIFERVAFDHPQRVALVDESGSAVSYQALNERANGLARELRDMGVHRDVLVGLCAERGVDAIVGMLAILKAGAAYVPIDPAYPANRIGLILQDSGAQIIVTTSRVDCVLGETDARLVFADEAREDRSHSTVFEASDADDSSLAYVIYTSGSTGTPKGVLIEHGNASRLFTSHAADLFACGSDDVWLWYHSIGFDFSVWEIWGALLLGGTLVVASYETTRSPRATLALVRHCGVTVLNQTPSAFRQFSQADLADPQASESLRLVIFGGEALDVSSLKPWFARYGDEQPLLINMYGITETTVHVTHRRLTRSDAEADSGVSPIGVPLPDLQIHLLDDALQPVAGGVAGEMYVSGPGVARGYVGAPDLTAQRFPALTIGGQRVRAYRSGDLAQRVESGEYTYLGRTDDQIKVRGFRIEPKEVESTLLESHTISDCVVKAHDYGEGDVRLIAFVIAHAKATRSEEELISGLTRFGAENLPLHMRPSAYFVISEIPLSAHGKVDRAKLQPTAQRSAAQHGVVLQDDEVTRDVVQIWNDVLGAGAALDGDFFDVGGTSLALIRMLSRLNERLSVALDPSQLLEGVTIDNIVKCINGASSSTPVLLETV